MKFLHHHRLPLGMIMVMMIVVVGTARATGTRIDHHRSNEWTHVIYRFSNTNTDSNANDDSIRSFLTQCDAVSTTLSSSQLDYVIDTDVGTDIDDSFAIALALMFSPAKKLESQHQSEFESESDFELDSLRLAMILTGSHDTVGRAKIVAKYLTIVNRTDIPVAIGIRQDDVGGPLFGWAADFDLDNYEGTILYDGIQSLIDLIERNRDRIIVDRLCGMFRRLRRSHDNENHHNSHSHSHSHIIDASLVSDPPANPVRDGGDSDSAIVRSARQFLRAVNRFLTTTTPRHHHHSSSSVHTNTDDVDDDVNVNVDVDFDVDVDGFEFDFDRELVLDPIPAILLIEIAPAGNLAELITRRPDLVPWVRVVAMSGSMYRGYGNSTVPCPEYNVYDNVHASQLMYAASWNGPIVSTPLDTSESIQIHGTRYQRMLTGTSIPLIVAIENWVYWVAAANASADFNPAVAVKTLYDPVAIYLAYGGHQEWVTMKTLFVTVNAIGMTIPTLTPSYTGQPAISAAVDWTDLDAFEDWLVSSLM